MKRERGVCSAENGGIVVEDWTILFGNKTNSKDLPKCRNKRSKSILWRCNFTETAEWKRKGIASGGIMPKQQKGEYKYFVSFGVPEYPHQCSLASQTPGKASSTSPPKCSPCPTVDFVLYDNWGSSGAAPYVESSIPGHWWWLWSGGREGTEVWPVPVLCPGRASRGRFTARVTAITTECCLALKVSSHSSKVRESQKLFLIHNELPVNLQVQTFL